MFRRLLILSVGTSALLFALGAPSQLEAATMRGMRVTPPVRTPVFRGTPVIRGEAFRDVRNFRGDPPFQHRPGMTRFPNSPFFHPF